MSIKSHFQQETLENAGVFLEDEEEGELFAFLDELITLSEFESESDKESARNIAGLTFVAGRSYQRELDEQEMDQQVEAHPGKVPLWVSPATASRLLEFLLGEE